MKTLFTGETGLNQLRNGEVFHAWDIKKKRFANVAVQVPETAIKGVSSFGNYIIEPTNQNIKYKVSRESFA